MMIRLRMLKASVFTCLLSPFLVPIASGQAPPRAASRSRSKNITSRLHIFFD